MTRTDTDDQQMRAWGYLDPASSHRLLKLVPGGPEQWVPILGRSADPDLAALQLVKLYEAQPFSLSCLLGNDKENEDVQRMRLRLSYLLGASEALGDYLIGHPQCLPNVWEPMLPSSQIKQYLLDAVGAQAPDTISSEEVNVEGIFVADANASADELRRAYNDILMRIATDDLTSPTPVDDIPYIARALSDLADAAIEAALALARRCIDPNGQIPLSIIAMGKTGGRELNYVSDVDLIYVVEAPGKDGRSERDTIEMGSRLVSLMAHMCSGPGNEAPLWTIDSALRPEGKDGALVRTVDSYVRYYSRWAKNWEYQALLKARFAAGNTTLGRRFIETVTPFIWDASGRDGFVENVREMRGRVEASVPTRHHQRELKLAPGGLRDVEFTVQLLQLVHGRSDPSIRLSNTFESLKALSDGGYVSRSDAAELLEHYEMLRAIEHRAQLQRMRRTHLLPSSQRNIRQIARSLDMTRWPSAETFLEDLNRLRSRVRFLYNDVFFRPIVSATAKLSPDEATLDPQAAIARLSAIGYVDPRGALGHIAALTKGTSRRATIQRHLLPIFMEWLGCGADPDMGLLNFRMLSDQIGNSHWYLALLRDSGLAAERLCDILATSRWIADGLEIFPQAVEWLDNDKKLEPVAGQRLMTEIQSIFARHDEPGSAMRRIQSVRDREVLRAALSDALSGVEDVRPSIAQVTDAAVSGALQIACRQWEHSHNRTIPTRIGVIGMGRFGGLESSYASDADIMIVHGASPDSRGDEALGVAAEIAATLSSLLGTKTSHGTIGVDMNLRPEGKAGPVSRTVESYLEYYGRWGSPWERQALLRARPVAGDTGLLNDFFTIIDPLRYERVPDSEDLQSIRLLKARMEQERLPRGIDPSRHVKLGPGGLSDVEWTVQLLQMRNAYHFENLRTTSTLKALHAAVDSGLLEVEQSEILLRAWSLASRIRAGNVLTTGRMSGPKLDVLPNERKQLVALAHILGYQDSEYQILEEDWLRSSRQARGIMDELFWN